MIDMSAQRRDTQGRTDDPDVVVTTPDARSEVRFELFDKLLGRHVGSPQENESI